MAHTIWNGGWREKISVVSVIVDIHVQEEIPEGTSYARMDIIVYVEELHALIEWGIYLHASVQAARSLNSKEPHVS